MSEGLLFLMLLIAVIILAPVAAPISNLVSMVVSPRIKTIQATFQDWFASLLFFLAIIACEIEERLILSAGVPIWYDLSQKRMPLTPSRILWNGRIRSWAGRLFLTLLGGIIGLGLGFLIYPVTPKNLLSDIPPVDFILTLVFGFLGGSAFVLMWIAWRKSGDAS